MTQLADVFKLNPQGLNVRRAVGVAVVVMLLAGLLREPTAKTAPQAPAHQGQAG